MVTKVLHIYTQRNYVHVEPLVTKICGTIWRHQWVTFSVNKAIVAVIFILRYNSLGGGVWNKTVSICFET